MMGVTMQTVVCERVKSRAGEQVRRGENVVLRCVDWGRADALNWREGANEKVTKSDEKR